MHMLAFLGPRLVHPKYLIKVFWLYESQLLFINKTTNLTDLKKHLQNIALIECLYHKLCVHCIEIISSIHVL